MAKSKIKVGGLTIKDIMNIPQGELSTYSLTDIKNLTSRLVSAGNKRARRFIAKYGVDSIKLKSYTKKGKFSVKGLNTKEDVIEEFGRVSEFLSRKTSSIKGYKAYQKQMNEVAKNYGDIQDLIDNLPYKSFDYEDIDEIEVSEGNVWQTLDDVLEGNRSAFDKNIVYEIHDVVKDYMETKGKESSKDFEEENQKEIREIIDNYIQGNLNSGNTFNGNY